MAPWEVVAEDYPYPIWKVRGHQFTFNREAPSKGTVFGTYKIIVRGKVVFLF